MKTHLVTGATGFVGAALILEILDRTDDNVIAIARRTYTDAHTRLTDAIRGAAMAYGRDPGTLPLARVRGIAGDVTQPGCGITEPRLRADVMWHSAASLRYEDRYAADIFRTNVDGTRNTLDIAREAGVGTFNYISTAYVVGRQEGRMMEVAQEHTGAQNHYERSKITAESLVRNASDSNVRIFRPSIVVGHSRSFAATAFSGLYGFVRQMIQYRAILDRMQPGLHRVRPLRIWASADIPLNMIPIDAVASQAVQIGIDADASGVYHLTQADPPTFGASMQIVADLLGFPEPEIVDDTVDLDAIEQRFDKRLEFYNGYIRGFRVFDRSRADAALGENNHLRRPLPSVGDLVGWYLSHLAEQESVALPTAA